MHTLTIYSEWNSEPTLNALRGPFRWFTAEWQADGLKGETGKCHSIAEAKAIAKRQMVERGVSPATLEKLGL